ncbi:NAD(P)-binding protein [Alkalilimnicola ehrlichii]|uniref:Glucose-methanol-choline oxidoreductase N-terminal domain-containing protein n=1 Tax=Alkalilimnicola ehrlichii TaxID=351052 RepID=A0A3E0WV99_9GAMM|nr:NAD(P)-binding protein [Alkalilimnicola ehrlichii]RFA36910.1 hypothetical protein CAL65_10400 [Alkalilimnicola ehrlichii]
MNEHLHSFDTNLSSGETLGQTLPETWDAVIVGAGAAGAVFARELTAKGLKVLMLEFGKHYQDHANEFVENELGVWEHIWDNSQYEISGNALTGSPNLGRASAAALWHGHR